MATTRPREDDGSGNTHLCKRTEWGGPECRSAAIKWVKLDHTPYYANPSARQTGTLETHPLHVCSSCPLEATENWYCCLQGIFDGQPMSYSRCAQPMHTVMHAASATPKLFQPQWDVSLPRPSKGLHTPHARVFLHNATRDLPDDCSSVIFSHYT